jgi:metal-responsive CopG/Arc/MetJ family transcriptional regulator
MKKLFITLPEEITQALDAKAASFNTTRSYIIEALLRQHLASTNQLQARPTAVTPQTSKT